MALGTLLAPISDRTLRNLLRESGYPLAPVIEGVRQDSYEELRRTLCALADEYQRGDREWRKRCRAVVIEAKDHAKLATRRAKSEELRARKQEMVQWMLVWLENPGIFEEWVSLRVQKM
jgi:hypothetical protein